MNVIAFLCVLSVVLRKVRVKGRVGAVGARRRLCPALRDKSRRLGITDGCPPRGPASSIRTAVVRSICQFI